MHTCIVSVHRLLAIVVRLGLGPSVEVRILRLRHGHIRLELSRPRCVGHIWLCGKVRRSVLIIMCIM